MASSFLSIYSDSWTLSERPGSNLIQLEAQNATNSDSGSSTSQMLRRLTAEPDLAEPLLTESALAALSIAERSTETLRRVSESMRRDHVPVSPQLIMHRHAWDVEKPANARFPLDHVPIKCNILQALCDLLSEYQSRMDAAGPGPAATAPLEHVAKVLHYLSKLIQAAQMDPGMQMQLQLHAQHRRAVSSAESHDGGGSGGGGRSRIFSRFFAPAKSRGVSSNNSQTHTRTASAATKSTITVMPVGSAAAGTGSSPEEPGPSLGSAHKIQDYTSMHTYKESITSLAAVLRTVPHTDQNNIVFHFVDHSINPFIMRDCRDLLRYYVEQETILRL
ncbi:LAFA_0D05182g1_1 [Lachancea sp. 'fantastica']|nr:LAFA_0D05182g1_1 [Lachancea sp. 'fantastica']